MCVETHFFPCKSTHLLNGKGTDISRENLPGVTDDNQNYKKCECEVKIKIGASKRTRK